LRESPENGDGPVFTEEYTLEITIEGEGTIIEPADGEGTYDANATAYIIVEADEDFHFSEWAGPNATEVSYNEDEDCYIIKMDSDKEITAVFAAGEASFAGGQGTAENPYRISNWFHLDNVRHYGAEGGDNYLEGRHFILIEDLDSTTAGYSELVGEKTSQNPGWEPIAISNHTSFKDPFRGFFDGNQKKISDLYVYRPEEYSVGLFGYILEPAEIKNITLLDVDIVGDSLVGGLVGENEEGIITNVHVEGDIKGSEDFGLFTTNIGGVVGTNIGGEITEASSSNISVSGNTTSGGLVGYNDGSIKQSFAKGTVKGLGNNSLYLGGLVGENWGKISDSYADISIEGVEGIGGLVGYIYDGGILKTSFALGSVEGSEANSTLLGGLVGEIYDGEVSDCYAVTAVSGGDVIGGLTGGNDGIIKRSYSAGLVEETDNSGGFIGLNNGTIENSHYDSERAGQIDNYAQGAGTENMTKRDTFVETDWDFQNIWDIEEDNSYPYLRWQENNIVRP